MIIIHNDHDSICIQSLTRLITRVHWVGWVQPAIGVHDPAVHRVGHAVDRVADVLARGDLQNKNWKFLLCVCHDFHLLLSIILTHKGDGSEEDDDGASVVESEDMVVDADWVPLVEQAGDPPEDEGEHAGT